MLVTNLLLTVSEYGQLSGAIPSLLSAFPTPPASLESSGHKSERHPVNGGPNDLFMYFQSIFPGIHPTLKSLELHEFQPLKLTSARLRWRRPRTVGMLFFMYT